MIKTKNFYILLDSERAFRMWRISGKRCTFGTYCLLLQSLGYRLLLAWCIVGAVTGVAWAEKVDTAVIAKMESSGNVFARNGEHYGLCQISKGVLHDYNKTKRTRWGTVDLYNGIINLRIAEWYLNEEIPRLLKHYKMKDSLENRLTAWRLGIRSVLSNGQATKYVKKYNEIKRGGAKCHI